MGSPGVASHFRLQGFGQVVVLTECGHGVMARRSSPQPTFACRGQTLRRRVEGGSKASARCSLQNVYKRRQSHRPGPLPRPPSLVSNVPSEQHLHCAALHTPHCDRDRYLPVTVSTSCVVRARRSLFTAPPGTPDELASALAWSGTTSSNKGIDAQMHELCSDLVAQLRNGREQWMRAFSGP